MPLAAPPESVAAAAAAATPDQMTIVCQCGLIQIALAPKTPVLALYHCHCTECRAQSSSAFGTSAIVASDALFPLAPAAEESLSLYTRPVESKPGTTMQCWFCRRCGSRIVHRNVDAEGVQAPNCAVKGGVLQGLDWEAGGTHIFTKTAVVPVPDGAVKFEGTPPPN